MSDVLQVSSRLGIDDLSPSNPGDHDFENIGKELKKKDGQDFDKDIKEWIGFTKDNLVDDFIFQEVLRQFDDVEGLLERYIDELNIESDEEAMRRIRSGDLFDKIMNGSDTFEQDSDEDLAQCVEYYLRGEDHGKRIRPALSILTGFSLFNEVDYLSTMVGAVAEGRHAPSLMKDDEMDEDEKRRGRGSVIGMNNSVHGSPSWPHSVLNADILESWSRRALGVIQNTDEIERNLSNDDDQIFNALDAELSKGQNKDVDFEDERLQDVDIEQYKDIIDQKTGALFKASVEPIVETFLREENYSKDENDTIRERFNCYVDSLNFLFQAGDDVNELFNDEETTGKTNSDIGNRKKTFNALITRDKLKKEEEYEGYGDIFENVFDDVYDEVTEDVRSMAEEFDLNIEGGSGWKENFLEGVMLQFRDTYDEKIEGYLDRATEAVEDLYDKGVINETAKERYQELAVYVWERES